MERVILLFCLCTLLLRNVANAQLNDAQWMLGPNTSSINFRTGVPTLDSILFDMNTGAANSAISDSQGNLLYYTNGVYIAGKLGSGDSILNGNGINPCPYTTANSEGLWIRQSSLFLNRPGSSRYYYLIHFSGDINNGIPYTLMYSVIDKDANFGLGGVILKNDTIYQQIFKRGGLTACKHANGRDWWFVLSTRQTNEYNIFLLTPDGIKDTLHQNIGPVYMGPLDDGYSCFSMDGAKYATGAGRGLITVMDFDRCTGQFSNPVTIYNNSSADPVNHPASGISSIALSPNGRFIYATNTATINQYDLWSGNVQDSVEVFNQNANMDQLGLAYNGRIYASTFNGGYQFLSVINSPDELGSNCNFVYGGQPTLSVNSYNISNTANPRLGSLNGSGCDTINTDIRNVGQGTVEQPRITPNPADKGMYIEMPRQGNYVFELLNANGQLMARRETKQVDIINTEALESGVYFLRVTDKSSMRELSTVQVVVRH